MPVATIGAPTAFDMEGDKSNDSDLLCPWLVPTGLCGLQAITGNRPVTAFQWEATTADNL